MSSAIKTITSMVLVSIHPFALRKLFLVILAFLCFSAFCFADPVLMVRRFPIRGERSDNLKTSSEKLAEPFASPLVPLADRNEGAADGSDSGLSESASRPVKPRSFSFKLGNPACIRRSTISPAGLQEEPSGFELRKT